MNDDTGRNIEKFVAVIVGENHAENWGSDKALEAYGGALNELTLLAHNHLMTAYTHEAAQLSPARPDDPKWRRAARQAVAGRLDRLRDWMLGAKGSGAFKLLWESQFPNPLANALHDAALVLRELNVGVVSGIARKEDGRGKAKHNTDFVLALACAAARKFREGCTNDLDYTLQLEDMGWAKNTLVYAETRLREDGRFVAYLDFLPLSAADAEKALRQLALGQHT
jgi:hypothetical protein